MKCQNINNRRRTNLSHVIGKRFGKLVISERVDNKGSYSAWKCICDCGNIKIAKLRSLRNGDCVSCGCKRKSRYEEIPGSYFGAMKQRARKKNVECNISKEYMWNLFLTQNRRCSLSGMDIIFDRDYRHGKQTASLDRINPSLGYVEGNVRWVHKKINQIRMDMDDEEFLTLCRKVIEHATM